MSNDTKDQPEQITLTKLREDLARCLATVAYSKKPITVTQHGKPYVTICPLQPPTEPDPS